MDPKDEPNRFLRRCVMSFCLVVITVVLAVFGAKLVTDPDGVIELLTPPVERTSNITIENFHRDFEELK